MRLLARSLLPVIAAAVAVSPLAGAPRAVPRLVSKPAATVGAPWTGVLLSARRPVVTAQRAAARRKVAVRPAGRNRYRLRAVFPSAGRWQLLARTERRTFVLGAVLVRAPPARLTNAVDVVVEPSGALLVADLSNRIFRLAGGRVTVVAGNGRPGRSGDGGPATRAAIGFPVEVAVDPRGGFALVHGERWVSHVDRSGVIRTVGEFAQPTALAYDSTGNLFVSELPGRVRRVAGATGAVTNFTGFNQPHGLAVAGDGTVYVADTFNNRVQRIAPEGGITTLAGSLNSPNDVALGPDGNVYATDYGSNRILRITPGGAVTAVAASPAPSSVAVAADGSIYVTERGRATVRRIAVASLAAFCPTAADSRRPNA